MARKVLAVVDAVRGNQDDAQYDAYLLKLNQRFLANLNAADGKAEPLFTTDAAGLWDAYLDELPPDQRQFHNCHACRRFVERFGGLVTIDANGFLAPAFWSVDDAPELYHKSISKICKLVRRAKVTGVFLCSDEVLGQPETGVWHHLHIKPPKSICFHRAAQTAGQAMAEKREDFKNVLAALGDFSSEVLDQALTLLRSEALYRSENVLGQAEWLQDLQLRRFSERSPKVCRDLTWRAVATAPAGFCHPRSSMIGTLLEDLAAGMSFEAVSRRFADKMHPLQYQRPQVAPKAGNIAQAEKIIAQLSASGALDRRFARLDEVQKLWSPVEHRETSRPSGGVFGHLQPKGRETTKVDLDVPHKDITWAKFSSTVLPDANQIDLYLPFGSSNFCALVTAVNPDAPPIIQWDLPDRRNHVSCYVYHGGSPPSQWGLAKDTWVHVTAVTLQPSMWNGGFDHQGKGAIFLLKDCVDSREDAGNALFPEIMKAEFREIRATIEAYSKSAKLLGREAASACGIRIQEGLPSNVLLRVTDHRGATLKYKIDRWD